MRIRVIKLTFYFIIFTIILRLFYWQILKFDDLTAKAEGQRVLTKEVSAARGDIRFSDGSVLATNQPTFLVFAEPRLIVPSNSSNASINTEFKKNFARKVAEVFWDSDLESASNSAQLRANILSEEKEQQINEIKESIFNKISQDLLWVSLNRNVTIKYKHELEKLDLPGIGFDENSARFYPESSSSAHILGFVGSDAYGNKTGYFGLEGFYNGELRGKRGMLLQENDALGLPILIGKFYSKKPIPGKTLVLNIDRTVQYTVENELKKGLEKYGAKSASAVVMDPKTGNILAMASLPSYNPSNPAAYPKENHKNPIIADGYEPGSTFKVLVMGAGINEGLIKPDTICDICAGPLQRSGFTIRTWNNQYRANSTMTDVIVHSDNTGMVYVGQKLGIDKMYEYIQKFGFGNLTGIDLQDEYSPDIRPKKDWKEIDLDTASFGQGISVTALQIVKAVGAIANEGKLMEPHVVSEIIEENSRYKVEPKIVSTPISKEAAKAVTEMMVKAVDEGESKFAKPKGYRIAGKTGTAQIPVAGHYDPNKTIASFVGFAPADDPKFIMLVRYSEPSSSIFGSETAAPTFFAIAKELFTYYGISPEQ